MDAVKRKHRDFIQNIAIVLLSLSAAALFTQAQLYQPEAQTDGSYFSQPLSPGSTAPTELTDLAAPVRVAVTGAYPYGRYGDLRLTTRSDGFGPLATLLRDALSSAASLVPCDAEEFLSALSGVSVYYDFLDPLPLPILAGLVGAAPAGGDAISAQRLVLSGREDAGVQLYLWDGGTSYLRCGTVVSYADLSSLVGTYELGTAVFAFDSWQTEDHAAMLAPCSLFLLDQPEFPALTASDPLSSTDWLLSALGFNPHTNYRYWEANGSQVIMEGDSSLRIQTDGTVLYQSGGQPVLEILPGLEADTPALSDAVLGVKALLSPLLEDVSGDADLYLRAVQRTGGETVLRFGYQVEGLPIRFADGGCAAEVTLEGTAVTKMTLRFRQYAVSGEASRLLPLKQALAIAAGHPGAEMSIGYADNGGGTVSAQWLLD